MDIEASFSGNKGSIVVVLGGEVFELSGAEAVKLVLSLAQALADYSEDKRVNVEESVTALVNPEKVLASLIGIVAFVLESIGRNPCAFFLKLGSECIRGEVL